MKLSSSPIVVTGVAASAVIPVDTRSNPVNVWGSIVDGGLFLSAPNAVVALNNPPVAGPASISGATVSFVMGSRPDIITLQPAP